MDKDSDRYIAQLEERKRELEQEVHELKREIRSINNLIIKEKSAYIQKSMGENVNKKNAHRIFIESAVIEVLGKSKNGLRTSEIFRELEKIGNYVNYNTLRIHITRMRDKGMIKKKNTASYRWISNIHENENR